MASTVLRHLWAWRTVLLLVLTPLLLLPIPMVLRSPESKCAYIIILMAVYWITESLPVGVTALIPVFLFPLFEIVSSSDIAAQYMNDVNMLFLGGLTVAIAIEYWNLHRRVALKILMFMGSEPRWLMLGMMLATWFLSMWISNTATTAMMVPITEAILVQLKGSRKASEKVSAEDSLEMTVEKNGTTDMKKHAIDQTNELNHQDVQITMKTNPTSDDKDADLGNNNENDNVDDDEDDPNFTRLCKGMSLSICYAANSGGIASLTGTGPNLALKSYSDIIYSERGLTNPVSFGSWMGFGLPLSALVLLVCWLWLQVAFLRCRGACDCCAGKKQNAEQSARIKNVIHTEYLKLGPIVFGQVMVIILFLAVVILWITRDLGGVAGWGTLFDIKVKDGAAAILIAVTLFGFPSTIPCLKSYKDPSHPEKWEREKMASINKDLLRAGPLEIRPLLNWKVVQEKMPWHLFLLLGGGYALSKGAKDSGLSTWIGVQLEFFSDWNQWAILFIICYVTAAATEVTSNTAIAQLLMPIMSELAINTGRHPLYYMFPAALSCSFAFMLPVATPPNAIVFTYGRIRIADMVKAGLVMNILAVPILVGVTGTVGDAIFDFHNIPVEFLNHTLQQASSVI